MSNSISTGPGWAPARWRCIEPRSDTAPSFFSAPALHSRRSMRMSLGPRRRASGESVRQSFPSVYPDKRLAKRRMVCSALRCSASGYASVCKHASVVFVSRRRASFRCAISLVAWPPFFAAHSTPTQQNQATERPGDSPVSPFSHPST